MNTKAYTMRWFISAAAIVLFLAVVVWLFIGLDRTEEAAKEQQLAAVQRSVENGVTLCYSIEGAYPESLEYLIDSYGVSYDSEHYIVHYDCFAANIRPTVTVLEREA